MTLPPAPSASAPAPRRRVDVLGIVAVALGGLVLLPTLGVFLIGLIPEFNAIWWLGLVLIPLAALVGAVVLILAVIGLVLAVRGGSRYVWSVIGLAVGVLLVLPVALLYAGSLG